MRSVSFHRQLRRYVLLLLFFILACSGGKESENRLIADLKSADAVVRYNAAWALGRNGTVEAVPGLIEVLTSDSNAMVRHHAAWALGKMAKDAQIALPSLIRALTDSDWAVRRAAVVSVQQFGPRAAPAAETLVQMIRFHFWLLDKSNEFSAKLDRSKQDNFELQTKQLIESSRAVCLDAIIALGRIGTAAPGVAPALVMALESHDREARMHAAAAAGAIGPEAIEARESLSELMKEHDQELRRTAVEALGRLKSKRCIPSLTAALADQDDIIREQALTGLALLGTEAGETVRAQIKMLDDPSSSVRKAASHALRAANTPEAAAALNAKVSFYMTELQNRDWDRRREAADALADFDTPEAETALKDFKRFFPNFEVKRSATPHSTVQPSSHLNQLDYAR